MKSSLRITSALVQTAEQNLKEQNRIWKSRTEFETAEQNLKQQNKIWNNRTEFVLLFEILLCNCKFCYVWLNCVVLSQILSLF